LPQERGVPLAAVSDAILAARRRSSPPSKIHGAESIQEAWERSVRGPNPRTG